MKSNNKKIKEQNKKHSKGIQEPKEELRIYIDSETYIDYSTTEESNNSYSEYTESTRHTTFNYLSLSSPDCMFYDSVIVDDKSLFYREYLYLAVIFYGDGSTFGHVSGNHHIVGVFFSEEKAQTAIDSALNGFGYKPWEGHFSSFESSDIFKLELKDNLVAIIK